MHERGRERWIGLVLAAVLVGPAAARGELAGSAGAEVYGHAWVQAWATAGWPAWPTGTDLAVGAERWPVIDPLPTWLAAGAATVLGPTAAWNLLYAAAVVGAAVGGGALARAFGGSGLVGAVGLPLMPVWLGSLTSGLTEDAALGLAAAAVAALRGGRHRLGGVLLGLVAWCGLYLAWLAALAALGVGLTRVRADGWRRWMAAAALAALVGGGAAVPFADRLAGEGHRSGAPPAGPEPLWRVNPWRRADLASFVTPGKVDVGGALVREHPTYLGAVPIGLALLHPGPGLLYPLGAAAVAAGETPTLAGRPLGVENPVARAFRALPLADRFNHLARVMLLGQAALVVGAARGARRLGERRGARAEVVAAALLAAEVAAVSPARVPLPGTPTGSPAIYAALADLPPGPLLVLGAAGPGIHPQRVFYDQRAHGRRLLANPNRPGEVAGGRPAVVVALGPAVAGETARRGPPDRATADGAAWVVAEGR